MLRGVTVADVMVRQHPLTRGLGRHSRTIRMNGLSA